MNRHALKLVPPPLDYHRESPRVGRYVRAMERFLADIIDADPELRHLHPRLETAYAELAAQELRKAAGKS